jgi:hypothetical protein
MLDAERFVNWCAARDVPLVMHGHKHVPRHIVGWGEARPGVSREVTAVGCGTTLGVEGRPLSYNILSWQPHTRKWVAEFFSDSAGGGFLPDYTVVHTTAVAA